MKLVNRFVTEALDEARGLLRYSFCAGNAGRLGLLFSREMGVVDNEDEGREK
jgi:hypothetical protein